ncbi:MAG: 2-phospho-L-lactate transferase [Chloroflexi bacterium]|nr:2-phospho-L-lactate transferase [Chloroflexota bacterium]
MKITVLCGGVGAARLLAGLAAVTDSEQITAICNVGDDLEWHGLHVSPDIDTVLYTLAGIEGEQGWGMRGDTTTTLEALRGLDSDAWFTIGDRDLATHLLRTARLRGGETLAEATATLARARGVRATVLPVTNDPHPTVVQTPAGDLPFQVYFVQRRATDAVTGFFFPGLDAAQPAPGVLEAIESCDALVFAPSNPFVSIQPILAVPGVRDAVRRAGGRRVAVSPIVGGAAVKGPAADMMRAFGHEVSALGVARLYAGLVDRFVVDTVDAECLPEVRSLGMDAVAFDTMMVGDAGRARVAASLLEVLV